MANVLLVGLERNIAMPQESITFNNQKKENTEKHKEKYKQRHQNNKNKIIIGYSLEIIKSMQLESAELKRLL